MPRVFLALVVAAAAAAATVFAPGVAAFDFSIASLMPETAGPPIAVVMQARAMAAVRAAVDDVNADPSLLSGHTLSLDSYNSGFSGSVALPAARSILFPTADGCGVNETTTYHAVIGGISSGATATWIFLARAQGVPVVTAFASSPSFSDKSTYPNMLRTNLPVIQQNDVFLGIMNRYGWKRAAILTSDDAYGAELLEPLLQSPLSDGLDLRNFLFNFRSAADILRAVTDFAASDYRVVLVHTPPTTTTKLTDAFEANNLFHSDVVVITTDSFRSLYLDRFATDDLLSKMRGWLHTSVVTPQAPAYAALGARLHAYDSATWPTEESHDFHDAQAYDTVLAIANGIEAAVAAAPPGTMPTSAQVLEAMSDASFTFSGTTSDAFAFDENLDRAETLVVTNRLASGELRVVEFDSDTDLPPGVVWPNGATGADFPPDTPPNDLRTRSAATEAAAMSVAALCLVATAAIQAGVHACRASPVIRAASVPFCHAILAACSLAQVAVIVNASLAPSGSSDAGCSAFPAMLALSYAGIFGALVSKTQRLNAIFNSTKVRVQKYSSWHVARPVAVLVAYNAAVCAVWFAVDRPVATLVEDPTHDRTDVYVCQSPDHEQVWFGLLVGPAAGTAIVACYLAYRVRNLMGHFNEAKQILACVYNLTLLGSLTLGLVSVVGNQINVSLALQSFSISFIAVSTAVALFAGKFYLIYTGQDKMPATAGATSPGTKITASGRLRHASASTPRASDVTPDKRAASTTHSKSGGRGTGRAGAHSRAPRAPHLEMTSNLAPANTGPSSQPSSPQPVAPAAGCAAASGAAVV